MEDGYVYSDDLSKKAKVTLTINSTLLKNLDKMIRRFETRSRSELMENILRQWLKFQARKKLEEDTAAYYQGLSPQETKENKSWAKLSSKNALKLWS